MLRAILAVIVGYVVLFIFVVATLSATWFALGADFAYNEGTYEASTGWSAVAIVLGVIAAVIGGLVTASIARTATPVKVLAGIVLVLGLVEAVNYQVLEDDESTEQLVRTEDISMFEAATKSQPPAWYSYALPLVGCAGVLLGGRMRRCCCAAGPGGEA